MSDNKRKIQELNVLEKILEQDRISLTKKNLGDEEIVSFFNDMIKDLLSKYLDSIFAGSVTEDSQFSPEAAAVLNEFANRLLAKARAEGSLSLPRSQGETPPAPPPSEGPQEPENIHTAPLKRKSIRQKGSPILDALQTTGFDPKAPVEERVKAMKKAAKERKK